MKTKYKNLLWILAISLITLGFSSCSSDDDDVLIVEESSNLTLAETDVRVVVGVTTTVDIIEGNGDYTAFSLNEDIATVELVDNKININALTNGRTTIVVSDKNNNYKSIAMVSFYEEIILKEQNVEIKMRVGNNGTKKVTVLGGNGGYIATSEDPDIASVSVEKNDIIIVGKKEGTVNISIVDQLDVETMITATVVTTTKAYEGEELEELKNDSSQRFFFDGSYSTDGSYSSNIPINTVEGEYNVYGWDYYGYSYQKVYFKGDKSVGKKEDALFTFNEWRTPVHDRVPIDFEIVKNDGVSFWAIFSFIQNGKLFYGYFVRPL